MLSVVPIGTQTAPSFPAKPAPRSEPSLANTSLDFARMAARGISHRAGVVIYHGAMKTLAFLGLLIATTAYADFRDFQRIPVDPQIERALANIADDTLRDFSPKLQRGHLSITLIDVTDPTRPRRASFDGAIPYHPASVVKMPYLAYTHHLLEKRRLRTSAELERAMRDMIVDSSNDATHYIVDVVTNTTSGPELNGRAFDRFAKGRGVVNRFYHPMGYDTSMMTKTFCEDIYGRDKQLLGEKRERRNRMTSDSAASLIWWIVQRKAVTPARSEAMLALMERRVRASSDVKSDDSNVNEFIGEALPPGSKLWSKPGWTSEVRHDAAYVELPNGKKYVLAVFTRGHGGDLTLLPAVSAKVVALLGDV